MENERDYTYSELDKLASREPLFKAFIDPDDNVFFNPPDMVTAIEDYCKNTGQQIPQKHGEFVQIILQSLAMKSRVVLEQVQEISERKIKKIIITGGGNQNTLLNQYIANATGVKVITALSEGTAAGNIMVQAMALGEVHSLTEIRQVIQQSMETQAYEPQQINEWNQAYSHFIKLIKRL